VPGPHAVAPVALRAARRDGGGGRAQRVLPALASLRPQGVASTARAAWLARARELWPGLGAIGAAVPCVSAAGVLAVPREDGHRLLPGEARSLAARRRDRAARQARALGDFGSDRTRRFTPRLRVPD